MTRHLAVVLLLVLISHGAAAAGKDAPVAEAVAARDASRVQALLRGGVDVNIAQSDGATALHWAAHWNDVSTAALLIRAHARINAADDHGVTPLSLASTNGSIEMVDLLLRAGANANAALISGETPLMTASRTGSAAVVQLLLARGADIRAKEHESGQTALMWAVAERHLDVIRLLVESGADVNARSLAGFTPLMFAAQQGIVEAAAALVAAGADVNAATPDGSTPLLVAADSAHKFVGPDGGLHAAVGMWLLEHGADPNKSEAGRMPLHSAVQAAEPELVKALLAHGAAVDTKLTRPLPQLGRQVGFTFRVDTVGATPFWLAAKLADVDLMRVLLKAGADPLVATKDGTTALMAAAGLLYSEDQDRYGRRHFGDVSDLRQAALEASKLAVEHGVDVNAANAAGVTALHGSVLVGGTELARFLIQSGAKMNVRDKQGRTPLMLADGVYNGASFKQYPDLAKMLRALGAEEADAGTGR